MLPDGELGFEHTGLQERAVALFVEWVKAQAVPGLSCEVVQLAGRTPLIFCEIAADAGCVSTDTVSLCLGAVSDRGGRLAAINRGLARVRTGSGSISANSDTNELGRALRRRLGQ